MELGSILLTYLSYNFQLKLSSSLTIAIEEYKKGRSKLEVTLLTVRNSKQPFLLRGFICLFHNLDWEYIEINRLNLIKMFTVYCLLSKEFERNVFSTSPIYFSNPFVRLQIAEPQSFC